MLSRDSEDQMWSRFVFERVIWPQEVTLVLWTQPSGPLCLWQCFYFFPLTAHKRHFCDKKYRILKRQNCLNFWICCNACWHFHSLWLSLWLSKALICSQGTCSAHHVEAVYPALLQASNYKVTLNQWLVISVCWNTQLQANEILEYFRIFPPWVQQVEGTWSVLCKSIEFWETTSNFPFTLHTLLLKSVQLE